MSGDLNSIEYYIDEAWKAAPQELPDVELLKSFFRKLDDVNLSLPSEDTEKIMSPPCIVVQGFSRIEDLNALAKSVGIPHTILNLEKCFIQTFHHAPGYDHLKNKNETLITAQARSLRKESEDNPPPPEGIMYLYYGDGLDAPPMLEQQEILWGEIHQLLNRWRLKSPNRLLAFVGADASKGLPALFFGRLSIQNPGVVGLPLSILDAARALLETEKLWELQAAPDGLQSLFDDAGILKKYPFLAGLALNAPRKSDGALQSTLSRLLHLGQGHVKVCRRIKFAYETKRCRLQNMLDKNENISNEEKINLLKGCLLNQEDGKTIFAAERFSLPNQWKTDSSLVGHIFGQLRIVNLLVNNPSEQMMNSKAFQDLTEEFSRSLNVFSDPEKFAKVNVYTPSHVLVSSASYSGIKNLCEIVQFALRQSYAELNFKQKCAPIKCFLGDCSELFAAWLGDSEKRLRRWFAEAQTSSSTCILILDGIDRFALRRSGAEGGGGVSASSVESRLVTSLLTCLEETPGLMVIGTCSCDPMRLDEAVTRPGRLGRWVI